MQPEFEWDETKRLSNIEKHGIDFEDAAALFDDRPVVERQSAFVHEERFTTTGWLNSELITVIWTRLAERIRIISARRARDRERRAYRALYPS